MVPIVDIVEWESRIVPIVEYATGGSLRDLLDRRRNEGTRLSVPEVLDILRDSASGLGALHASKIVHRDVTPKNILLRDNRQWAIADLGIARLLDEETIATGESAVYGSLLYISAEQKSNPHGALPADDVFSLGQVLFFLATMVEPHGNAGEALERNPDCPRWLSDLIEQMRSYNRRDRPVDCNEVLRLVNSLGAGL